MFEHQDSFILLQLWCGRTTGQVQLHAVGCWWSVTEVLMRTERGSCSEACDPVTWVWGECP